MTKEEALNILKELHDKAPLFERGALEVFFPEFKDDEVERIRKSIIELVRQSSEVLDKQNQNNMIAWLEKQCEEKSQSDSKKLSEQIKDFEGEFGCWNSAQDFRPKHLQRCLCYDKYMKGVYCYVYDDISKYWCTQTTEEHDPDGDNHICDYADYRVTVWMSLPDTSFYPSKTLLEKQGEQKVPINDFKAKNWYVSEVDGKIHDMTYNPTDKAEQKFKVGDWIITKDKNVHKDYSVCKIVEIENNRYYHLENGDYLDIDTLEQYDYRLWTIQDAKDGDVLAEDSCIFIIRKLCDNSTAAKTYSDYSTAAKTYCTLFNDGDFDDTGTILYFDVDSTKPATKEQRDLLFKKMAENGYAWDTEKKETKLLISNGGDFEPELSHQEATKKSEQLTNWTDEDERMYKGVIGSLEHGKVRQVFYHQVDWLKSIKERLQ